MNINEAFMLVAAYAESGFSETHHCSALCHYEEKQKLNLAINIIAEKINVDNKFKIE